MVPGSSGVKLQVLLPSWCPKSISPPPAGSSSQLPHELMCVNPYYRTAANTHQIATLAISAHIAQKQLHENACRDHLRCTISAFNPSPNFSGRFTQQLGMPPEKGKQDSQGPMLGNVWKVKFLHASGVNWRGVIRASFIHVFIYVTYAVSHTCHSLGPCARLVLLLPLEILYNL